MSYLHYDRRYTLQLFTRNEGKIKSYDSCCDVRAWSHDVCKRSRYLREWIKCDMPLCVVPVATLLGFFRAMTCRKGGKATPRCHPDCKSKVILDSIITSCDAIRDCLKGDESLEKFFIEEELETGHWPCERCLEVLKSVKLFWRILLERVFAVNLTKAECCEASCTAAESVRDMARVWQKDIVQQAMFVKCITPELLTDHACKKPCIRKVSNCRISAPCSEGDARFSSRKTSKISCGPKKSCSQKRVTLDCSSSIIFPKRCKSPPKRCKSTTARTSCVDVACEPSCGDEARPDLCALQRNFNIQKKEIDQLKKENAALKCQLQKMAGCQRKARFYCGQSAPEKDCAALVPVPFECCIEDSCSSTNSNAKDADSELIITMKNCKHKSYRHVSLLQVLHKTNDPCLCPDTNVDGPCYKNEDPIDLLTKVQTTLGAMVKKEIALANCRKKCGSNSEIEACFRRVNVCKSVPNFNCTLG